MQVMQVVNELDGTPWLWATRSKPRNHLQDRGEGSQGASKHNAAFQQVQPVVRWFWVLEHVPSLGVRQPRTTHAHTVLRSPALPVRFRHGLGRHSSYYHAIHCCG